MKEKGKTIAVLGAGFNHIYPGENVNLVKEIIKYGGAIISEHPPNTEVNLSNFPIRNRIIAGIASSTIVVEAKARSGSSVTARHSSLQGKKVYCVPGRIGDKTGRGTNNLIKKGAHILTDINEILSDLGEQIQENEKGRTQVIGKNKEKQNQLKENKKIDVGAISNRPLFEENTKVNREELIVNSEKYKSFGFDVGAKSVRNTTKEYRISPKENKEQIQCEEEKENNKKKKMKVKKEYIEIYKLLKKSPTNINKIARTLNINIAELNMKLTMMEIDGLIETLPGNIIKKQE